MVRGRRASTAARVDKAFVRLVRTTCNLGLPEWATAEVAKEAMWAIGEGPHGRGWQTTMTSKQMDALLTDYGTVVGGLGRVPWEQAGNVT